MTAMMHRTRVPITIFAIAALLWSIGLAMPLRAEDNIEKAGVAVGVTAGNMWFIPLKASAASMGALFGGLSFILSGGNAELTKQIWEDTLQGPFVITPELARKGIGERPLLNEK
jgi:hypothetical protein